MKISYKISKKQILTTIIITAIILSSFFIVFQILLSDDGLEKLEGLKYINHEYEFGFDPPEGWNLTENITVIERLSGINWDQIEVAISQKTEFDDHNDVYFKVFAYEPWVKSGLVFDEIIKNKLEELEGYDNNFIIIESNGTLDINDFNSYDITWRINTTKESFNKSDNRRRFVYNEKNSRIITFYYSAPVELFDEYETIFEESLNSLEIV